MGFFKKFKNYVLILVAALIAAVGYFAYGVPFDTASIFKGDVSTIGQSLEDAPTE